MLTLSDASRQKYKKRHQLHPIAGLQDSQVLCSHTSPGFGLLQYMGRASTWSSTWIWREASTGRLNSPCSAACWKEVLDISQGGPISGVGGHMDWATPPTNSLFVGPKLVTHILQMHTNVLITHAYGMYTRSYMQTVYFDYYHNAYIYIYYIHIHWIGFDHSICSLLNQSMSVLLFFISVFATFYHQKVRRLRKSHDFKGDEQGVRHPAGTQGWALQSSRWGRSM